MCYMGHMGATWRIRLNRRSVVAMRSYVILLWPLVIISVTVAVCLVVACLSRSTKLVYVGPVGCGMDDRLWAGKPRRYITSHPGQLSLAIPPDPPSVGAISTGDGLGHAREERNNEFCVTVGHVTKTAGPVTRSTWHTHL